jgi:hypothetical protein
VQQACEDATSNCATPIDDQLSNVRNASYCGRPLDIHLPAGRSSLRHFTIDNETCVSAVRIRGSDDSSSILHAVDHRLLSVLTDHPHTTFHSVIIRGQIFVRDGSLDLFDCIFDNSTSTDDGGALVVAGSAVVSAMRTSFRSNVARNGGAVMVLGGRATFTQATFRNNHASGNGSALFVMSGIVHVSAAFFSDNLAEELGGAIMVHGGELTMTDATHMISNRALQAGGGNAIRIEAGQVRYFLPAPFGTYVPMAATAACGANNSMALAIGPTDEFPPPCNPGFVGSIRGGANQVTPQCSGPCPKGQYCPGGTHDPIDCEFGTYCLQGSSQPISCPAGETAQLHPLLFCAAYALTVSPLTRRNLQQRDQGGVC